MSKNALCAQNSFAGQTKSVCVFSAAFLTFAEKFANALKTLKS